MMTNKLLEKKDVMRAWGKYQIFAEVAHSYERMQAIGVVTALGNCLKKIYSDNDDSFKRALQRHLTFFNTNANAGGAVLGMAIAMEEQMKDLPEDHKDEAINSMKTSLMGPLAGVGDSIDWGMLKPTICGLGVSLCMQGNAAGILLCLVFCLLILFEGRFMWWLGYEKGSTAVTSILSSSLYKRVIKGAQLIGLFMMGALTASYVTLNTVIEIPTGDAHLPLQGVLDSVMPGLLPLGAVLLLYYIMAKKSQHFGKVAIGILGVSILCSVLGIF